jgi:RNA polymerase sigma factor (sigma-70 family)
MLDDIGHVPQTSSAHISIFAERYNKLLEIARSLANNDKEQAKELVHDALIEFAHHSPDLTTINNIDHYLRSLMRNMFKSQKRRICRHSKYELLIENYDLVESGLSEAANRYGNPHLLIQIQDILRFICEYACVRKEKLKLGSVLILRFFHGYYTSEIAQLMGVTASAVSHLLKLAKSDACLYLSNSDRLNYSHECADAHGGPSLNYGCLADDLLNELRNAILRWPRYHDCPLYFQLQKMYEGTPVGEIDSKTLSHIVSCESCLDAVNAILGLDPLSMRYPIDSLNRRTKGRKTPKQPVKVREAVTMQALLPSIQL